MPRRIVQQNTRERKHTVAPLPPQPNKRVAVQSLKREVPKLPTFSSPHLIKQIQGFIQQKDKHYYLGFGGLGDALLLMAVCWEDPNAKVVFFANQIPFIKNFFEILGISVFLHDNIMGTKMASHIYDLMRVMPNFKSSAHLADGLDFNDWSNENKYMARIKKHARWIQHFGKKESGKPVIIIGPSGSHKDAKRQRYLHVHEYQRLVDIHLNKGYKVYAAGSLGDLHHFGLIDKPDFYWLNSDKIYDGKGNTENSNLTNMLRIINSAEHVISMDTWLKTYTLLCDIPTTVIETRWDNAYRSYGQDITDWIFLNFKIWPNLKIAKIESLLTLTFLSPS